MKPAPQVVEYRPAQLSPSDRTDLDEQVRNVIRESGFSAEFRDELTAPETLRDYVTGPMIDLLNVATPSLGVASWITFGSGGFCGALLTLIAVRESEWGGGVGRALLNAGLERYASDERFVAAHTQNPLLVYLWLKECARHRLVVEPDAAGAPSARYIAAAELLQRSYQMTGAIDPSTGVKHDPSSGAVTEAAFHLHRIPGAGLAQGNPDLKDRVRELMGRLTHPADMLTLIGFRDAGPGQREGTT